MFVAGGEIDCEMGGDFGGRDKRGAPCAAKGAGRGGGAQLLRYCGAAKSRTQRSENRNVLNLMPLSTPSLR